MPLRAHCLSGGRFRKLADELKEARAEQDTREEAISMELRRTTHEKQKSDVSLGCRH